MSAPEAEIAGRLEAVRARIARAAARAGRDAAKIRLVGVSKRQPPERIAAAARAGLRELGESYLQEARAKLPRVRALLEEEAFNSLRWHLIGRLQRNKARQAIEHFSVIHSVDRAGLAEELDRRAQAAARRVDIFLQVNLSQEPQKGGASPESLPGLLERARALPGLRVVGLMTVPAWSNDPEASRPTFRRLAALHDALCRTVPDLALPELSMGMSGDFDVAIEEGATVVRVGTAIFGARDPGGNHG